MEKRIHPLFLILVIALITLVSLRPRVHSRSQNKNLHTTYGGMPILHPHEKLGASLCTEINPNNLDTEITNFRLSQKTLPLAYDLWLYPNMATQNSDNFAGYIKIDVTIKSNTDKIVLHQNELVFDQILIDGLPIQDCATYLTNEFLIIYGNFVAVESVSLEIYFSGLLFGRAVGFFKSHYKVLHGDILRQQIIGSKHEPTYARKSFPCFDGPGIKVPISVHLIHPKDGGFFGLSNMPTLGLPKS